MLRPMFRKFRERDDHKDWDSQGENRLSMEKPKTQNLFHWSTTVNHTKNREKKFKLLEKYF